MEKASLERGSSDKRNILQTVGVAVMPVLSLFAANVDRIRLDWIIRPAVIYPLVAIGLAFIFRTISKDWKKAALSGSLLFIVLSQFGRIPNWMQTIMTEFIGPTFAGNQEGTDRTLLVISILLPVCLILFVLITIHLRSGWLRVTNTVIDILVLSSIITSAILVGGHIITTLQIGANPGPASTEQVREAATLSDLPDVYYLILDAYGRADVLEDIYAYDNTDFLQFLDDRGCYVAEQSRTNYVKTALSLTSSLNLDYVHNVLPEGEKRVFPTSTFNNYIKRSVVIQTFEDLGYKIVTFETGFVVTDISTAEYHLDPIVRGLNPFESLLLSQSIAVYPAEISILFGKSAFGVSYSGHIARQLYILDTVPNLDVIPSPKFVFAHIILPHLPFVFHADGEVVIPNRAFSFNDGDDYKGTTDEYLEGYVEQLKFLNGRLESIIDSILSKPGTPPVIILQADHGPRMTLEWRKPSEEGLYETFSIFNTYCIPGKSDAPFYPEISPVNTFRVLFNLYFGTDYPMLPDESYYDYYWNHIDRLKLVED